ncbi:hypothetical protein EYF80_006659 [Liparis tanakae]|uniref:Uncharacterized protein n=1 Tax=Liparis tanakae TaxID=230148 RepID=A0A4Z2J0I0_9TELE|nr:hypothetical protein EYF80_006659 [Liparis tanakae]
MQKHVGIASPCSVSSAAASIPSADWDIFSLVACCCCAWTPTELNTLAMKPPGMLLVGGIMAPNIDSLTASWPVAPDDCANATGGDVGDAQVYVPKLLVLLLYPFVQSPCDLDQTQTHEKHYLIKRGHPLLQGVDAVGSSGGGELSGQSLQLNHQASIQGLQQGRLGLLLLHL